MKNIAIIGTGYVGLVTGVGLSEFGNKVICVDINQSKINDLNAGKVPIYEPGLEDLIRKNVNSERLFFSSDMASSIKESEVIIIAVGTPQSKNGAADLKYVFDALNSISENLNSYKVIVTKSTVPIGTGEKIITKLKKNYEENIDFDYVSNPEFLREGSAVKDFLWPDRVIIGTNNEKALQIMRDIYRPLYINKNPIQRAAVETSEMIKYASNSFLALKISFINEIANLCESVGADVHDVAIAMGKDGRISDKFLHPGPGFGGSCFPKDTMALANTGKKNKIKMNTVEAAIKTNNEQKLRMVDKIKSLLDNKIKDKTITVLGLAFKPKTDDIRDAASTIIIPKLINEGAII
ncbi:MAG: UDP-glucose/GDP-mannose dehydrogenase family protein, partial [Candidatus Marinimicrobia bacterium]|nr:UDP-glucose/GDP-mannose dehydrogenase family protein [Candidatus Neomarinimicrobiota bacterium]